MDNYFSDGKGFRLKLGWLEKNNSTLLNDINKKTLFLPETIPFKERVWYFINNQNKEVTCHCGNKTKFMGTLRKGFSKFCSQKCASNSDEVKNKIKKTSLEKYGVEHHLKLKTQLDKQRKTNLEKYGYENIFNDKEIIKKTIIKKYGVDNPFKSDVIKEKIKKTSLEKYGVDNPSKNDDVKNKKIKTSLLNYGVEHHSKTKEYRFKYIKSKIENYENLNIDIEKSNIDELFFTCGKCNQSSLIPNNIVYTRYKRKVDVCIICNPIGLSKTSNYENIIIEFLKQNCIGNIIQNDRTILNGKEIDIYLPDHNIGIEINGLYWHSEECGKDKNYHLNKTIKCSEKGVKLIHIFEDEWLNNPEIVKSRLLNLLNKTPNKIYGRKCIIKELINNECKSFLNENHLQGYTPATYNIGLFYNDELVSLMTFGKRKITGKNSLELIRFCNKINTNVMGSASKLFKYFIEKYKPEELISYADIRWSGINPDVTLYNKLGFKLKHMSSPNYWYNYANIRYHRYNFRKDKLIKDGFDPNKTEREIMLERGYTKIWDCGNLVFTFKQ
jgi:hypothetical protein